MTNLKTLKLLSISLLLVIILSSCSPLSSVISPTPTIDQNLAGNIAEMTLQVNPTAKPSESILQLSTATAPAPPTPTPPNTPVWSAYNYTCELVSGGSNMTMNLNWFDRSDNEESYIVYRNKQVIATLPPNSTSYVDVAFVAPGKTLSYYVEAFNNAWQTNTSTITYGCQ